VSWANGATALALLAALQLVVAWLGARFPPVRTVVTAGPTYLVRNGEVLDEALRARRVTRTDVHQAVRWAGPGAMRDVAAVVLETDGSLSVVPRSNIGDGSALTDVPNPHGRRRP
jgi:uncharacterized membrane protein YcaP (DUF421 family)